MVFIVLTIVVHCATKGVESQISPARKTAQRDDRRPLVVQGPSTVNGSYTADGPFALITNGRGHGWRALYESLP